jgi:hypothetical protein
MSCSRGAATHNPTICPPPGRSKSLVPVVPQWLGELTESNLEVRGSMPHTIVPWAAELYVGYSMLRLYRARIKHALYPIKTALLAIHVSRKPGREPNPAQEVDLVPVDSGPICLDDATIGVRTVGKCGQWDGWGWGRGQASIVMRQL